MRSPEEMATIQIDITNACVHNCSNCTRLCGHHKKNFFMNYETFRRAVDSLEGFEGRIGIMGGEPTLHPEFERFVEYIISKYPDSKNTEYLLKPTRQFIIDRKLEEREYFRTYAYENGKKLGQRTKGPGLWSSLGSSYYRYFELIQDVFNYQCLNDHMTECFHQPVLVSRKDLGIGNEKWEELRNNCWVQNRWSATITPKGAFFCEVAGALDMLFDGMGGWKIEKGWWRRNPEDFGEQLKWCELCGLALNTPSRNANDEVDDASETLYRMLEEIKSPKFSKGQVQLFQNKVNKKGQNRRYAYHKSNLNRLNEENDALYKAYFPFVLIASKIDTVEEITDFIRKNIKNTEKMIIFVDADQLGTLQTRIRDMHITEKDNKEKLMVMEASDRYGENLNMANSITGPYTMNLLCSPCARTTSGFRKKLKKYIFNPGVIYSIEKETSGNNGFVFFKKTSSSNNGHALLYSPNSYALRHAGFDGIRVLASYQELKGLYSPKKCINWDENLLKDRIPLNAYKYEAGITYAIYGSGRFGEEALEAIYKAKSKVAFYVDTAISRQGQEMRGKRILSPDALKKRRSEYQKVIIATVAYKDVRNKILSYGITDADIIAPFF